MPQIRNNRQIRLTPRLRPPYPLPPPVAPIASRPHLQCDGPRRRHHPSGAQALHLRRHPRRTPPPLRRRRRRLRRPPLRPRLPLRSPRQLPAPLLGSLSPSPPRTASLPLSSPVPTPARSRSKSNPFISVSSDQISPTSFPFPWCCGLEVHLLHGAVAALWRSQRRTPQVVTGAAGGGRAPCAGRQRLGTVVLHRPLRRRALVERRTRRLPEQGTRALLHLRSSLDGPQNMENAEYGVLPFLQVGVAHRNYV